MTRLPAISALLALSLALAACQGASTQNAQPATGSASASTPSNSSGTSAATLSAVAAGFSAYDSGDFASAAKHFRSAAEQAHTQAQAILGAMYMAGTGVPQDYAEAHRWFLPAAKKGNLVAQSGLGHLYEYGKGVPQDFSESARWYRLAADQEHATAQTRLGNFYAIGMGVAQDYAEALRWLRAAAEQDHADAQLYLGALYSDGEGVTRDPVEALMWMTLAAEQGGEFAVKMRARNAQKLSADEVAEAERRAADWRRAYRAGELSAPRSGSGAIDTSQPPAELAFKQGEAAYAHEDYAEAARWVREAAGQGHAEAQYYLGVMYEEALGVPRDVAEAKKWLRKASEQNLAKAQGFLGLILADSDGDPEERIRAQMWLMLAAAQGDEIGVEFSESFAYFLSDTELAEAKRRAEQWRADFQAGRRSASEGQVANSKATPAPQPRSTAQGNQAGGGQLLSTLGAQLPQALAPKPAPAGSAWENARQALARQDYEAAARWLRVEAEQGDVAAMGLLGTLYLDREGVGRDYGEALRWLRPAAEQGDASAQAALGGMYELGRGLPENRPEAARWYRLAAESGNAYAQSRLGTMYMSTSGPMPQDDAQAIRWLRAAAEQNEPHAQAMLGLMYAHGRGVVQDLVTAQVWLNLGGAQGSNFGRVLGPDYAEKLTPAERAEAERRAEEWLEAYRTRQRG